mmetsp:Transcript_49709/g.73913  ORF Transcript_49709/g.73913 Transcript_49709/m.73913 type:complete len:195 (-) Transcript_49709:654-1238(-)|eukprot:CAMPEP_0195511506 /NCGR_PEP_ID=MMETSP0794_2-20130614/3795_1 /TAXON_ID=515487 /ORGANISM="Stephanopyxis turris, Strain CCMP 815" /LENGTH=194 /DNA_ID=CAMNT_0040639107 /DNA_START=149 /DNA_END=736 /DNA_ORIENTATION=+
MAEKAASAASPKKDAPPSPVAIFITYIVLGSLISFGTGREPGTLPAKDEILREMAPALIVVCGFLASYEVWDVMGVGMAWHKTKLISKSYKDLPTRLPEELYLAQRVQTNQVEQIPIFLIGTLSCALFVNGRVAGVLGLIWAILRRCYASTYRGSVGAASLQDIGLAKFTVPAYFAVNSMLMATAVHAVRCLFL